MPIPPPGVLRIRVTVDRTHLKRVIILERRGWVSPSLCPYPAEPSTGLERFVWWL